MDKKTKDDWLTVRIGPALKNQIKQLVDADEYPDMSTFVIEAIQEKLKPKDTDQEIKERIRSALQDDPTLLDDSLRRIGIRFYAQK